MKHRETVELAIIGGGASGLMAALSAVDAGCSSVLILERHARVGKKLLATGNGRCNLTNINANPNNYYGEHPDFCRTALSKYPSRTVIEYFERIGVMCKVEEEGRVYPYSDQASSVLDCLRMAIQANGNIVERCEFDVTAIQPYGYAFMLTNGTERIHARRVIAATGGKASPNLCSDGSGYLLLKPLGHSVTTLFPALVQLRTDNRVTRALKGIKFKGTASLIADGKSVQNESGEILFAEYGLSGPPIFALSRRASEFGETGCIDGHHVSKAELELNLFPDITPDELTYILLERQKIRNNISLEQFITGLLHKRIGQEILKGLGYNKLSQSVGALDPHDISCIADRLCGWRFEVIGGHSFKNAQVTAGGISTSDVDEYSMESKIVPGLYLAGELLDIDGDCGGYNLQWAWSSGALAGSSAALSLKREAAQC